jgi:hypothetical protein
VSRRQTELKAVFEVPGLFTLTAIPDLCPADEHKGHLEYVTFIATDGVDTHKYWTTDTGTLKNDFAQIMTQDEAMEILARLSAGETVVFPGLFRLEDLHKNRFGGASSD